MQENLYHIMYLTPAQRATLKYLIRHYLNIEINKHFATFLDIPTKNLTVEYAATKASTLVTYIDRYENITNGWPLLSEKGENFKNHKSAVYYFNALGMKIVNSALEIYDESVLNILLGKDDLSFIKREHDKLKSLVEESQKHTYTKTEVQKALRS